MLFTQPGNLRHVDLVHSRDVRGSAPRENHVLRDLLAHNTHLFDAIAFGRFHWRRRSDTNNWSRRHGFRRLRHGDRGRTTSRFDETQNVILGDAATHSRAFKLCDIDAVLAGDFAHKRARLCAP